MNIPVAKNLYIQSDLRSFILVCKTTDELGVEREEHLNYPNSIEACFHFLFNLRIKKSEAESLTQLLKDIKKIREEMDLLIKKRVPLDFEFSAEDLAEWNKEIEEENEPPPKPKRSTRKSRKTTA